eukprot:781136-Alexandrium_andersonii.AAC.1
MFAPLGPVAWQSQALACGIICLGHVDSPALSPEFKSAKSAEHLAGLADLVGLADLADLADLARPAPRA